MKTISIASLMAVVACSNAQIVSAQWDFNSVTPDANPGTGTLSPSIGAGWATTISLIDGTFGNGSAYGGSSDPAPTADNSGWQTPGYVQFYPAIGQNGIGFANIVVKFDVLRSNTASRYIQFLYAVDGANFITTGLPNNGVFSGTAGNTWINGNTVDLSSIPEVPYSNFRFRIVPVVSPITGMYEAADSGSVYSETGTITFDMVTVSGEPVPEPASIIAFGIGASALLRRRARKA